MISQIFKITNGAMDRTLPISVPTDGLVLYAPLNESMTVLPTGQGIGASGAIYTTVGNVPCAQVITSAISLASTGVPSGVGVSLSCSIWIKIPYSTTRQNLFQLNNSTGTGTQQMMITIGGKWYFTSYNYDINSNVTNTGEWTHICLTLSSGNTEKLYINGILTGSISATLSPNTPNIKLGITVGNTYVTKFRVYNRALSDTEVLTLYNEPIQQ